MLVAVLWVCVKDSKIFIIFLSGVYVVVLWDFGVYLVFLVSFGYVFFLFFFCLEYVWGVLMVIRFKI